MGIARLLARGWIVFCLYAAGHAVLRASGTGMEPLEALLRIGVCVLLFGAMGLLFIAGYGLSAGLPGSFSLSRLKPAHLTPGFNGLVFVAFALLAFYVQTDFAPAHAEGFAVGAVKGALRFAIFGQRALEDKLAVCGLDGGRTLSSAFAWLLGLIFLGSALSRIRLAASIVRFEHRARVQALGPQALAFALGLGSVIGIQALYVGTAYSLMPCGAVGGILGDVLIGIGPLMLAYLIAAAITNLLALGPDS